MVVSKKVKGMSQSAWKEKRKSGKAENRVGLMLCNQANARRLSHANNQANLSLRLGRLYTDYSMGFKMEVVAFHKIDTFV